MRRHRNVKIVATLGPASEDYDTIRALHEAGAVFNPDWIARIEDMRSLRFMDWMETNGSKLSRWSERPGPADATFTEKGAPVEALIHTPLTVVLSLQIGRASCRERV